LIKIKKNSVIIGTAQLYSPYGITNFLDKKSKKKSFTILEAAIDQEIYSFDTAPGYNSEKILGEFITAHGLEKKIVIYNKIQSFAEQKKKKIFILNNIEKSIKLLGCKINTLFLHDTKNIQFYCKNFDFFDSIKKNFEISNLGISVYDQKNLNIKNKIKKKTVFQVPISVVDQRFENINLIKKNIIARSIFLQGLLINDKIKAKGISKKIIDAHKLYHQYLKDKNIDPLKLSLSYVHNLKKIDKFVIGVETPMQLKKIVNCKLYQTIDIKTLFHVRSLFQSNLYNPRSWRVEK